MTLTPQQAAVKQLFEQHPRHASRKLSPELVEAISTSAGASLAEQAFNFVHPGELEAHRLCPTCKREMSAFRSFTLGYKSFCSTKCSRRSPETKQKAESTCLSKFGVKNPWQAKHVKQAYHDACLAKYGVEHAFKSEQARQAVTETCLAKYGVEHAFKAKEVQVSAREAKAALYASLSWEQRLAVIKAQQGFELVDSQPYAPKGSFAWRHSCGSIQESPVISGRVYSCRTCKPSFVSKAEDELYELLSPYVEVERSVRGVIKGELDLYCPAKRLAIEHNGLYWHAEAQGKGSAYHLSKTLACEQLGIKLIHVFEDEWRDKRSIVASRLLAALGVSKRIGARSCQLVQVSAKTALAFQRETHLQGPVGSSVRLGLEHAGELVALMTFGKPRFNKSYNWELLRYSTRLNTTVVGGPSKLLSAFMREHSGSIISYADRRYSTGAMYERLGMTRREPSPPSFSYVLDGSRVNRLNFQKHKLQDLLGEAFDPALSAALNMKLAGHSKIYDCGAHVFTLERA